MTAPPMSAEAIKVRSSKSHAWPGFFMLLSSIVPGVSLLRPVFLHHLAALREQVAASVRGLNLVADGGARVPYPQLRTGNLRAVQLLLGHTKLESTVRYLGIEVDDALSIAEQIEL